MTATTSQQEREEQGGDQNGGGGLLDRLGGYSGAARTALRNGGLVLVLILLGIAGVLTRPDVFLTANNMFNILELSAVIGVVSVGMTFVIIGGGIDLSVGAIVALASVWGTTLATQRYGFWGMVAVMLVVGTLTGLVNGVLIAYGRLVPFIVTLAMLVSARGLAEQISNRQPQVVGQSGFSTIANDAVFGIPILVVMLAVVAVAGWFLLNRTVYGRHTFALGGNAEAARLAGVQVRRHTASLYALSGLCCGIAALMLTSRTTTGSATHGNLYELDAIAAVIIGGTLLSGGRGSLVGSMLGVLVFTTIANLFILNGLSTPVQNLARGVIIVIAVLIQRRASAGGEGST